MLRCTIELLPGGDESRARTIGCVEIANVTRTVGSDPNAGHRYAVVLKKTPPFKGALHDAWKRGFLPKTTDELRHAPEGEAEIVGLVEGFHRTQRGSYDLLYRALKACGLDKRNPA